LNLCRKSLSQVEQATDIQPISCEKEQALTDLFYSENACKEISANMLEILIRDFNRHHSNECQNLTICDEVSEAYIS